jgi:hypothetical protein
MLDWLFQEWHRSRDLFKAAPGFIGLTFLLGAALGYLTADVLFRRELATDDATITYQREQLAEYRGKLNGATPDQAAKEIGALRKNVDELTRERTEEKKERHLTDEQKAKLVRGFASARSLLDMDKLSVCPYTDPETSQYADEIIRSINSAGIEVPFCTMFRASKDQTGVLVQVKKFRTPPESAQRIMSALSQAGVEARYYQDLMQSDQVMILIGPKPSGTP